MAAIHRYWKFEKEKAWEEEFRWLGGGKLGAIAARCSRPGQDLLKPDPVGYSCVKIAGPALRGSNFSIASIDMLIVAR